MKRTMNVLFAAFEAVPFMKTGGLGDVAGSLPHAFVGTGVDVRVIMPKFGGIPAIYKTQMTHVTDFYVPLGWRYQYCGIEKLTHNDVIYYFVDNEYYFNRESPYGYFDDGERIAFFAKAVVESIQHLAKGEEKFACDILHTNDWHTALSPVFLREFYRDLDVYKDIKTIYTIHNLKFQGQVSDYVLGDILGLAGIPAAADQLRMDSDTISFMKGAVCYSDIITTVSPTYAEEIQRPFFGEHLDDIFRRRQNVLHGILNGIDNKQFDPEDAETLIAPFSAADLSGKAKCKEALQKELNLEVNPDVPVVVMIGRLTEQKGMDLVARVMDDMMARPMQLVVLGTGDRKYEDMLRYYAWKYPGKMHAAITFDENLSHRLYAGADMLLMPSLFEPCGLSQMIAMRYGTLPVVRETGGLKDSVKPYNQYTGEGTGFSFANYNAHEMLHVLSMAIDLYCSEPEKWKKLMEQAMAEDFSWQKSAVQYIELYKELQPDIDFTPKAKRTRKPKAEAPAAEVAAEEAPAEVNPKRVRKPKSEESAEETPAEVKPKRVRKPKVEESAEEAPAEEKPKRTRKKKEPAPTEE